MKLKVENLIEDLILELASRVGSPNLANPIHLKEFKVVMDDFDMPNEIQTHILRNLVKEDEFKNPILNKKVSYKDRDGNDRENTIGNLITLKKNDPGRKEAEKYLPDEGSEEREAINQEVGNQGKTGPQIKKDTPDDTTDDGDAGETNKPQTVTGRKIATDISNSNSDYGKLVSQEEEYIENRDGDDSNDSKKQQRNGYVGDKDKSIKEGDPSETEEYKKEPEPNDVEFQKRNKKYKNPTPPSPVKLDGIIKNPKFPKKYITMLERMANSKLTRETNKWKHFSDTSGGEGKIKAQFGELLTMVGSTLDDNEFDELVNTLEEYEKNLVSQNPNVFKKKNKRGNIEDNTGLRIMDSSWLKSARDNRKAILGRLEKQYGTGTKIIGAAWDNKDEVEAMGMTNYVKNKGVSTDCYFKVQTPDGEQVLDEVSLKKDTSVNWLNSTWGKFSNVDLDLPDELNQSVYKAKARKRNVDWVTQNIEEVKKFLNSRRGKSVRDLMKSTGLTLEQSLEGNNRDKQNVLFKTINLMSKTNESAKSIVNQDTREHSEFTEKATIFITENDKLREGMLNEIRDAFPLKAVSDGEETMAIGPNSLDKETMKNIFGTNNYDEIKEKLVANPGKPPFIGYRVDVEDDVIPVAKIRIREDGRGYGGTFKFIMELHEDFAKRLEQAQTEVYGS